MRRYSKVDKLLIATATCNVTTYECTEHGIVQLAVKSNVATCPLCKKPLKQVENVEALKLQYRKELRMNE